MYKNIALFEDFKIELKNLLTEDNSISDTIDGKLDFDQHFEKDIADETTAATRIAPPESDPDLKTAANVKPVLKKGKDDKYLLQELDEEVEDDDEDDEDLEDADYLSVGSTLDDEDDEEDFDGDGEDDIDPDELDNMTLGFDDEVEELADDEAIDDAEDKNIKGVLKESVSMIDQLLEEDGKDVEDEDLDDDDLGSDVDDDDDEDDDLKEVDESKVKKESTMISFLEGLEITELTEDIDLFLEDLELEEVLDEHVESDGNKRREIREKAKAENMTATEEADDSIKKEEADDLTSFLEELEIEEI